MPEEKYFYIKDKIDESYHVNIEKKQNEVTVDKKFCQTDGVVVYNENRKNESVDYFGKVGQSTKNEFQTIIKDFSDNSI